MAGLAATGGGRGVSAGALIVAIVGAESTGKTTLAQALAQQLSTQHGLRARWVAEHLRQWCDDQGRTPLAHEQPAIAQAQARAIEEAAADGDVVVCDTTPLMIAVYSQLIFGDSQLVAPAVQWHRRCAMTLLTALDLPWVADGFIRDGPHVRDPVDQMLRELLDGHGLPWTRVAGLGAQRVAAAAATIRPLLRR